MKKKAQRRGGVSFLTVSFVSNQHLSLADTATGWDETFRLKTTHDGRRLLEYLWRSAVRAGRIFIDPLCLPRRRCRVRISISSAEITIFIHKLRLERAHNKARGLPDQLTLLHLLRAANPEFRQYNSRKNNVSEHTMFKIRNDLHIWLATFSFKVFPPAIVLTVCLNFISQH